MDLQSTPSERTASRRAIEALRAGVPNGDAVSQLGSNHPDVEARFDSLLHQVQESQSDDRAVGGLLIAGNFGAGKSHLLEYLHHKALQENFACSKVVISKETSFADPVRLFRAATAELRVAGRIGAGVANVASQLRFNSPTYTDFFRWSAPEISGLSPHFAGSLYAYEYGEDPEFRTRIERFWAGDTLTNRDLGNTLKLLGQKTSYSLQKLPTATLLAYQRFRFLAKLIAGAGYNGWVVFIDEVELIGQYSFKARARAYGEFARWMGALADSPDGSFGGLGAVAAITSDFEKAVLTGGKMDDEYIPGKLRTSLRDEDHALATIAQRGMQFITKDAERLPPLSDERVRRTHDDLWLIYGRAFGWRPPASEGMPNVDTSSVMRSFVRRWITEWDIIRLFPGSSFEPEETPLQPASYREDQDLGADDAATSPGQDMED